MLRLYLPASFEANQPVILSDKQAHYALHVLRLKEGDYLQGFNGREGEWEGSFQKLPKKLYAFVPVKKRRDPFALPKLGLAFSPLKNERFFYLIEKAVELGVTDLFPLHTEFTQVNRLNFNKISEQMTSATQQCERFDLPTLYEQKPLNAFLLQIKEWHPFIAIERFGSSVNSSGAPKPLAQEQSLQPPCLIIGPEGGWSDTEKAYFYEMRMSFLDFGPLILRAETAAVVGLSMLRGCFKAGMSGCP